MSNDEASTLVIDQLKLGDLVEIIDSGPMWRVVSAASDADQELSAGVVMCGHFFQLPNGVKAICLRQVGTGDYHEITDDSEIQRAYSLIESSPPSQSGPSGE